MASLRQPPTVKKSGRNALRAVLGAAGLAALLLMAGLEGVDYRPYFQQPYYKETIARLRTSGATNEIERGELWAGFGRARLTPVLKEGGDDPVKGEFSKMPLAGYGARQGRPASGVHDELFVKAVALRVGPQLGIFFGTDALIVPREVADAAEERLKTELGLRREQLYFSATHTHCGIGGWGEGLVGEVFAGEFDPSARVWFVEQIVAAAKEAVEDLQAAAFGQGSFPAPEFVRNRLVGELGAVDAEFSYALVQQERGRLAVLGSYSAHATVLGSSVMEFSGDYPGFWQRAVEEATGGMAVFLAGAVGSHGPVPGEKGFAGAERMGEALAQRLLEELPRVGMTNEVPFGLLGLAVSLPELQTRISDGVRLRPWISRRLLPTGERSFLQAVRIDDSLWISTPCDFSGELALPIKESFRVRGFSAVITSFNGDYIGYVIPARYYHLEGYEPRTMSFYGPYVPDYLDELIRSLGSELVER